MANEIITDVDLDLYSPTQYQLIYAQQDDINSRYLRFTIWYDGDVYVFPKDMEAYLFGERADGIAIAKKIINTIDFSKNQITYLIEKDVISVSGIANLRLTLLYGDGNIISTIPFKIRITKNPLDDSQIAEISEYTALTETLSEARKIKNELDATHKVIVSQTEPSSEKENINDEWLLFY